MIEAPHRPLIFWHEHWGQPWWPDTVPGAQKNQKSFESRLLGTVKLLGTIGNTRCADNSKIIGKKYWCAHISEISKFLMVPWSNATVKYVKFIFLSMHWLSTFQPWHGPAKRFLLGIFTNHVGDGRAYTRPIPMLVLPTANCMPTAPFIYEFLLFGIHDWHMDTHTRIIYHYFLYM